MSVRLLEEDARCSLREEDARAEKGSFLCIGTSETEQAETPGEGTFPVVFERSSSSKKMGRKAPYRVEDSLYPTLTVT